MAEVKHYEQKVEVLESPGKQEKKGYLARMTSKVASPKKEQESLTADNAARVDRNKEKMESWVQEANVKKARARDLLEAIISRQDDLLVTIQGVFCSVVRAVGIAYGSYPTVRSTQEGPPVKPADGALTFTLTVQPQRLSEEGLEPPTETEQKEPLEELPSEAPSGLQPSEAPSIHVTPPDDVTSPALTGRLAKRKSQLEDLEFYGDEVRRLATPPQVGSTNIETKSIDASAGAAGSSTQEQEDRAGSSASIQPAIQPEAATEQLQAFDGQWNKGTIRGDKLTWVDGKTTQLKSTEKPGQVEITTQSTDGTPLKITGELQEGKLRWSNNEEWFRTPEKTGQEQTKQQDLRPPAQEIGPSLRRSLLSHQVSSPFQQET
jgi:hypothetical protein